MRMKTQFELKMKNGIKASDALLDAKLCDQNTLKESMSQAMKTVKKSKVSFEKGAIINTVKKQKESFVFK